MPKKLIDIYPPKKFDDLAFEESESLASEPSRGGPPVIKLKMLWFVLPLLVVPFLVMHFFFARASITVWPQITELHVEEQILAQVGQEGVDLEQKIIPARLFEQEQEATKSFPATGSDEREEAATGVIRIFNENASAQTLVVNSRFVAEDGKLFRSTEAVSVPAARGGQAGSADVKVKGAEPGPEYNIGPSNFSLPGLAGSALYTTVYGKSSAQMTGGAIGQTAVVTQADIDKAREQLLEELEVEAKKSLLSRIPPNYLVLESAIETELLEDNTLVQEGAALEEFTYTASIKISGLAFSSGHGMDLGRDLFNDYLQDTQQVKEETLKISYTTEASNIESGRMVLNMDISAEQYSRVDLIGLENRFRGASQGQFQAILGEFPSLEKAEFSLWPFWLQGLPRDRSRMDIDLSI